ncbi:hypothetical protein GLW00_05065 [Halobacillus litoralis]|uniref:Uncharacterized protein n=1 Tax=Halobacillus litoralis TaxID=45668 RepID=A0A845F8Q4_9BACI|nr:DUF6612 family protein [Halobacillus litoralis]MYL70208.1 hypothetical protein [Halobacillus litoralis]
MQFEASEVNQNLLSYAVKMENEQIIKMDEHGYNELPDGGIPIQSTIAAFHQTIETMGQEAEQFYSKKGLYMTNPTGDGWVKHQCKKL